MESSIVAEYKVKIKASGNHFIYDEVDEKDEELAHFYFIGNYESKEVVFDAVVYTLRFHYESELNEMVEKKIDRDFPQYKKILDQVEQTNSMEPTKEEEELGLIMAEIMLELEEEEAVKVKEHIEIEKNFGVGVGLEVGLNVDEITDAVIEKFIEDFNSSTLILDPILYSFQTEESAEEDELL